MQVDKAIFTVTKLYRDSLRLADYLSTRPGGGSRKTLRQQVQLAFRKNAGETDPAKVEEHKEAAIKGLSNFMLHEAGRISKEKQ